MVLIIVGYISGIIITWVITMLSDEEVEKAYQNGGRREDNEDYIRLIFKNFVYSLFFPVIWFLYFIVQFSKLILWLKIRYNEKIR